MTQIVMLSNLGSCKRRDHDNTISIDIIDIMSHMSLVSVVFCRKQSSLREAAPMLVMPMPAANKQPVHRTNGLRKSLWLDISRNAPQLTNTDVLANITMGRRGEALNMPGIEHWSFSIEAI